MKEDSDSIYGQWYSMCDSHNFVYSVLVETIYSKSEAYGLLKKASTAIDEFINEE